MQHDYSTQGSIPYRVLSMHTSACWLEPDIAVTWEVLPVHEKYRRGHSQPAIELSTGSPVEELEKGYNELKGLAVALEEQQYESPSTPRAPRDKIINQRVHMELPMAPET